MYAIIRAGGHQEKVAPGEQITVDRVKQDVGQQITFVPLVVGKDDGTMVSDPKQLKDDAAVVGVVVEHLKGDKIDVFMYRNKTGYRKHTGHRQPLSLIEISEIRFGADVAKAPEKPVEEEKPAEAPGAPEAAAPKKGTGKKAPAKRPAARKPAKAK